LKIFSVDANILIYAANGDSRFHDSARAFLSSVVLGGEQIFLCWEVLHAYFRLTTSGYASQSPMTFEEGRTAIRPLLESRQLTMLSPSKVSLELLAGHTERIKMNGNLFTDAVIASQLEANGIKTIYTNDADFAKFPYLKVKNPLQ
jgi:uncharacterized protein